MISDTNLYSLAVFLGCTAMLLIILYHFLELNANDTIDSIGARDVHVVDGGVGTSHHVVGAKIKAIR